MKKYLDAVYGISRVQESFIAFSALNRKFEEMTSLKESYEKSEVDPEDINQLVCPTKRISFNNTSTTFNYSPDDQSPDLF